MPRPLKRTVDYFPHFVQHGKTLLILQNEFGNDGYAFWFKLLSLLCKTDGQVYDYNNPASWRLLLAETSVNEDTANRLLQLLAEIDAIDTVLYQSKVIWIQQLVDNLSDVYTRRRNGSVPERPILGTCCLSCGTKLIGKRIGSKYCSDTCRQKGHRVTLIRDTEKGLMSTETQLMSTETPAEPVNVNRNPVNVNKNTQTRPDHTIPDQTRDTSTKKPYGEFQNVTLSDEEYEKLVKRFGQAAADGWIETLSSGIANKGYKYKNHYAAILSWERRESRKETGGKTRHSRDLPKTYTPTDDYPDLR